jgi:response regulator RpfG family c-di-GMP phosphodiesterase
MNKKLEVLCVDDEPQVLEGLRLHLKQHYVVHLAASGAEGLELLRDNGNIGVIVSDMRMPVMDGAKFLKAAQAVAPEAVRMLLTGYTDMQSSIAAVNEGQIFRFISKPCPPDQLLGALRAAGDQHRLIVAERVLLQQTLLGCVESLAKVLSLTKPVAFGRALRLRAKVRSVVEFLLLQGQWQIEAAAILSQLGAVTVSEEVLRKLNDGEALDEADRRELAAGMETSVQMLEGIPRLDPVLEILKYLARETKLGGAANGSAPPGALLLRLVLRWEELEAQGLSQADVFERLAAGNEGYDAEMLGALKNMPSTGAAASTSGAVAIGDLKPGMVLAEDLLRKNGVVILPRGFEIDGSLLEHIRAFADDMKGGMVKVFAHP